MGVPVLLRTPTDPQKEAIKFFLDRKNVGVRHGTGKGKTYLSICAAAFLLNKGIVEVVYIFHVKSALDAFRSEFQQYTRLKPVYLQEPEDWVPNQSIYLVQYSRLDRFIDKIKQDRRSVMAILDEIQVIKNPTSSIRKELDGIRSKFSYVLGLTATPLANHIMDLYWITEFIHPGVFGSAWKFKERFCYMKQRTAVSSKGKRFKFWEITGYKNLELLSEWVDKLWHSDFSEMEVRFKELNLGRLTSEEEEKYYQAALGVVEDAEEDGDSYKSFVTRMPALQKCVDESATKLNEVAVLLKRLRNEGKGVIVYFALKHAMADLIRLVGGEYRVLTGDTELEDRSIIREWFGPSKILYMTAAGSRSLNLHAGNQIVFYDVPFEIEFFVQTIGRVARPLVSTFDHIDVYLPYVENTIDFYRMSTVKVNADLITKVLKGGDPNLFRNAGDVKRKHIIQMRRDLLWRMNQT